MHEDTSSARDESTRSERRRWTIGLWIGALLCASPIVGLAATLLGMVQSYRVIDSERAPTPGALRVGVSMGLIANSVAIVLAAAGVALLALSLARLSRLRAREHGALPPA
jgi:biopolymer transport protein ExbB/TolQ